MDWSAPPSYEKFAERVGHTFDVRTSNDQSAAVVLAEVSPRVYAGAGGSAAQTPQQFSIVFHGRDAAPIAQGTYAFVHPELGEFALFIVPIGASRGVIFYEAVFG